MMKIFVVCGITAVALTLPAPALADPITIVSNGTGVAGLAYAAENGIEDTMSDPDVPGGPYRVHLSAGVGGSSADASAFIATDFSDPLRLRADGSTCVSYSTETGQAEGHVASYFFVFFDVDGPRPFVFDGRFETSGDAPVGPSADKLSDWTVSLLAMTADLGTRDTVINIPNRYDSTHFVHEGLLTGGLYRFVVQSESFGANLSSGPGSGNVFSNFTFSLDVGAEPAVPEPGSLALISTGLCAVLAARRRQRCV